MVAVAERISAAEEGIVREIRVETQPAQKKGGLPLGEKLDFFSV